MSKPGRKHRPSYSPKSPCPQCGKPKTPVSELCRQCAAAKRRGPLSPIEAEFEKHLVEIGNKRETVLASMGWVRRFGKHIGDQRLDRLTDDAVKSFFKQDLGGWLNRRDAASVIGQFLKFAVPRELVVVTSDRGPETRASVPVKDDSFAGVRQGWAVDKLKQQKDAGDDLIAKLGRKVIDHYVYFQSRLDGGPESLDELNRLADDCRELIQTNLPLFMRLSAQGLNVHSIIDERIQR